LKVLGIDPGLHATGYGIIGAEQVCFGVIKSKSSEPLSLRIVKITDELRQLIHRQQPDRCAIESLFFKKEAARSVILSAHLRGAIFLILEQEHIPIREITPAKVKLALTGNGRASKQQMKYMVRQVFDIENGLPEDAADALAVAYCALKLEKITN
jgi:crossover junction endodeoxyribonuclease RuvC